MRIERGAGHVTFDVLQNLFVKLNAPDSSPGSVTELISELNHWIEKPEVFANQFVRQAAQSHRDLWFPLEA